MTDILRAATDIGVANFTATSGRVPDSFQLLMKHAPAAFAGYGLLRNALMQDKPHAALDLKTKEFIFVLLDVLRGDAKGASSHAANAMRLGLTLPELAEGLVQVIMVGGVNTWNMIGQNIMRECEGMVAPEVREPTEGGNRA